MPSVAFFMWTLLFAQGAGVPTETPGTLPGAEDDSNSTASVVGVVTRSGTGEPVTRAEVVLVRVTSPNDANAAINALANPEQPPSSTTDSGGNFVIEDISPGEYRISAYRNGFVRQEYGQREPNTPGTPVDLIAGQEFDASFQMVPAGTITGRIYDAFGEPVPYAQVQAMQPRVGPDGQENFVPVQSDSTNDRGEYRLFWLNPGEYFVSAATSNNRFGTILFLGGGIVGGPGPNGPLQSQQMAAFFPGVPDVAQAAPITLRAGDELVGIDIRLEAKSTFTISGRVISPTQLGGFGSVMLRPTNRASATTLGFNSSPTDSQGNFTIQNVAPGSYSLQAQAQGIGGRRLMASLEVEVTTLDVENLVLTMSAGIDITGGVFVEEARTPGASEAVSGLNVSQLRVMLLNAGALSTGMSQPTDTEGGFQIEGVVPGEYSINVNMPNQNLYVKRILLGSEEITPGDPMTVAPGFNGQLNVLVSPNGGRINGVASNQDGDAMPNTTITLLPLDMPETPSGGLPFLAMNLKQARTGRNGDYSLGGIAPGEYRLFAWESTQPVPYMNADFMRRFEARGERVTVQEGDGLNLNLEVIPESETQ